MVKVHILSQCEYCSDHAAPTNSIRDSRGFDILIDGGKTSAGPVVVAYLRAQGVEDIDVWVESHRGSDHIGASSMCWT
jgi:beta-lactamase superfamily II metal-dependent hydrolase